MSSSMPYTFAVPFLTASEPLVLALSAGLAMWVHNLSCEESQYLDTWQNSDPGILNMVEALFKMPVETVAAAMQIDLSTAQVLSHRPL